MYTSIRDKSAALLQRYLSFGIMEMCVADQLMIRRSRAFALVTLAFLPVAGLTSWIILKDIRVPAGFIAGTGLLALIVRYAHLGGPGAIRLAVHVVIGSLLWINTVLAVEIVNGNALSVTYPAVLILATCYLLGPRDAIFWTAASIACLGWVLAHAPQPMVPSGAVAADRMDVFVSRAIVLSLICTFSVVERGFSDRASRKLEFLARHDSLTGLLNRHALEERLSLTLARCRRYERRFALLFIDLDDFKRVNDEHGHARGDAYLRRLGERIASITRSSDAASRMGGDEFTVLLEEYDEEKNVDLYAERLLAILSAPVDLDGIVVEAGASIGVARFPADAEDAYEMLRAADLAMYDAKSGGGRCVRFFADLSAQSAQSAEAAESPGSPRAASRLRRSTA
jgi:diguanylate cyclase (GGDEF)-like protein